MQTVKYQEEQELRPRASRLDRWPQTFQLFAKDICISPNLKPLPMACYRQSFDNQSTALVGLVGASAFRSLDVFCKVPSWAGCICLLYRETAQKPLQGLGKLEASGSMLQHLPNIQVMLKGELRWLPRG